MSTPTLTLIGQVVFADGATQIDGQPLRVTLCPARAILADDGTVLVPAQTITVTLDIDGNIAEDATIVPSDADATDVVPYFVQELFGDFRSGYVSPLLADGEFNLFAADYEGYAAPGAPTSYASQVALEQETADRVAGDEGNVDAVAVVAGDLATEITAGIALAGALATEVSQRAEADTAIVSSVADEVTARENAIASEVVRADAAYDPAGTAQTLVDALVDGAPGLMDTFLEISAALNDDPDFAAHVLTALAGKATPADITTAIDLLAAVARSGAYSDLTGKPTLGTAATHADTDFDTPAARSQAITDAITALGLGTASTHPAEDFATPSAVAASYEHLVSGTIDTATTGTLVANTAALISAAGGNVTRALPTSSPVGAQIIIGKSDSSTNTVTATGKINGVSSTSVVCAAPGETARLVSDGNAGWLLVSGAMTGAYDNRYQLAGSAVGSTLATGPLATSVATTSVGTTLAEINGSPLTIAPVIGSRAVDVCALLCIQCSAARVVTVDIWDATAGAALGGGMGQTVAANGFATIYVSVPHNPGAGARTYRPRFKVDTGTATLTTYGANNGIGSRIWCVQR